MNVRYTQLHDIHKAFKNNIDYFCYHLIIIHFLKNLFSRSVLLMSKVMSMMTYILYFAKCSAQNGNL